MAFGRLNRAFEHRRLTPLPFLALIRERHQRAHEVALRKLLNLAAAAPCKPSALFHLCCFLERHDRFDSDADDTFLKRP